MFNPLSTDAAYQQLRVEMMSPTPNFALIKKLKKEILVKSVIQGAALGTAIGLAGGAIVGTIERMTKESEED